jgi:hypothetical protein
LDFFSKNLGAVSEEQGERFHHDINEMERRYLGQCNVNMMGDYCWTLHCKSVETSATYVASPPRKRQYKAIE